MKSLKNMLQFIFVCLSGWFPNLQLGKLNYQLTPNYSSKYFTNGLLRLVGTSYILICLSQHSEKSVKLLANSFICFQISYDNKFSVNLCWSSLFLYAEKAYNTTIHTYIYIIKTHTYTHTNIPPGIVIFQDF